MNLPPEARARLEIDQQLTDAGWVVQDYSAMDIFAADGVAVREFPLKWTHKGEDQPGWVDYLLYASGKVIATVEAKPAGYSLQGVITQSENYQKGLPENVPAYHRPIPFAYRRASSSSTSSPPSRSSSRFLRMVVPLKSGRRRKQRSLDCRELEALITGTSGKRRRSARRLRYSDIHTRPRMRFDNPQDQDAGILLDRGSGSHFALRPRRLRANYHASNRRIQTCC